MAMIAREGDQGSGHCNGPGHPANLAVTITLHGNTSTTILEGKPICTVGCSGTASCGHTSTATTGGQSMIEGKQVHRVGDQGTLPGGGTYTVTSGSGIADAL